MMFLVFSNAMLGFFNIVCDVALLKYCAWPVGRHLEVPELHFSSRESSTYPFSQSRRFILPSIVLPPARSQPQQVFRQLRRAASVSVVYL